MERGKIKKYFFLKNVNIKNKKNIAAATVSDSGRSPERLGIPGRLKRVV
jgi:hypothetical protein